MKRIVIFFISMVVCICIYCTYWGYNYYAPPKLQKPYLINNNLPNDTLHIAYIGDSWAFYHHDLMHKCLIEEILRKKKEQPVKVHSYGICGLTSKELYDNLYNNDFKQFFNKRRFNYCFIAAGINDTYKKMSTDYYKRSMDGIIQFLLSNHIRPIILEIPDYNIYQAYEWQTPMKKVLRRISSLISGSKIDCKQLFRNTLDKLISEKGYTNKISIVRYETWNKAYRHDLEAIYQKDGMHLNEYGYNVLDSAIAREILRLQQD